MKKDRDEDDRRFFSDDDDDDVNDRDSRENTNDGDIEARGVGSPSSPSAHLEYVPLHRVILILVICIICIGCLASWIIILCTDLAAVLGIDQSTLGMHLEVVHTNRSTDTPMQISIHNVYIHVYT